MICVLCVTHKSRVTQYRQHKTDVTIVLSTPENPRVQLFSFLVRVFHDSRFVRNAQIVRNATTRNASVKPTAPIDFAPIKTL